MDTLLTSETLLVLAERPGAVLHGCGALIAQLCRAGRPPFVVVLTDGPVLDAAADGRVRDELASLGLDAGRLLMAGLAGAVPESGQVFDALVQAVCFVAWRHDCNVVLAPAAGPAADVARVAGQASGLGLGHYQDGRVQVAAAPRRSAREA